MATVLILDVSLSMEMRGAWEVAKRAAMTASRVIAELSATPPRIVCFSDRAWRIDDQDLETLACDFVYGSNLQAALSLAEDLASDAPGPPRLIMITDGEATAHLLADGSSYFAYPPLAQTQELTMETLRRCVEAGVEVDMLFVEIDERARAFAEELAEVAHEAVFVTGDSLRDEDVRRLVIRQPT